LAWARATRLILAGSGSREDLAKSLEIHLDFVAVENIEAAVEGEVRSYRGERETKSGRKKERIETEREDRDGERGRERGGLSALANSPLSSSLPSLSLCLPRPLWIVQQRSQDFKDVSVFDHSRSPSHLSLVVEGDMTRITLDHSWPLSSILDRP
jgi:hypothetical protein